MWHKWGHSKIWQKMLSDRGHELKDVDSRHPSGTWRTCLKWNLHNKWKASLLGPLAKIKCSICSYQSNKWKAYTDIIGKAWHLLANMSGFSATLLISSTSNGVLSIHNTCQGARFTVSWTELNHEVEPETRSRLWKDSSGKDPKKPEGGSGKRDTEGQQKSVSLNWSPHGQLGLDSTVSLKRAMKTASELFPFLSLKWVFTCSAG